MTRDPDEAYLIAARQLRDTARSIVRADLATLQASLAERPLTQRVRDRAVDGAAELAQDTLDLAFESRSLLGATLAGVIGWLFRKPLGSLVQTGWTALAGRIARWRAARAQTEDL